MTTLRPRTAKLRVVAPAAPHDREQLVEVAALAREAGLHPELVRRLIALGLLDPRDPSADTPRFPRDAAARLARAVRLRRDLGLNFAGAILAVELLEQIDELKARLPGHEPRR